MINNFKIEINHARIYQSRIFMFLIGILMTSSINAQDIAECRKIVDQVVKSIDDKSPDNLHLYLADDFEIVGHRGEVAKIILEELFLKIDEEVISHSEIKNETLDGELILYYDIEYSKMGTSSAKIVFNNESMLSELNLFKMNATVINNELNIINSSKKVIEIPFERVNNLILVDVIVNGQKRKFIFDSGAPTIILNSNKFSSKKDKNTQASISTGGINGNISETKIKKIKNLNFQGIQVKNQELSMIDMSHLESELKTEFYGLIGYEIVKDYDIIYNYENQSITLILSSEFESYKKEKLGNNDLTIIPLEMQEHLPVIKTKIDSKVFKLGIDCGGETNLIDAKYFDELKANIASIDIEKLVGADKNTNIVKRGNINNLKIDSTIFQQQSTVFCDISHLEKESNLNIDGLLGYPFLSKQKTLVSFNRKELILIQ